MKQWLQQDYWKERNQRNKERMKVWKRHIEKINKERKKEWIKRRNTVRYISYIKERK